MKNKLVALCLTAALSCGSAAPAFAAQTQGRVLSASSLSIASLAPSAVALPAALVPAFTLPARISLATLPPGLPAAASPAGLAPAAAGLPPQLPAALATAAASGRPQTAERASLLSTLGSAVAQRLSGLRLFEKGRDRSELAMSVQAPKAHSNGVAALKPSTASSLKQLWRSGVERLGWGLRMAPFLFPSPIGQTRWPTWQEREKIAEAGRRVLDNARNWPVAAALEGAFRDSAGNYLIDLNPWAAYHGAMGPSNTIVLTEDTVNNTSWAFIQAIKAREQTLAWADWRKIPASVEKLALAYAHMAIVFAELTNSSANGWETRADHNHQGQGPLIKPFYAKLLEAAFDQRGLIGSEFFRYLRDFTAGQVSSNPTSHFSLYEQFSGSYWRPGQPEHLTPIPANIERLDQRTYDAASREVYGAGGNTDNGSTNNFLGWLRDWFNNRGRI